MLTISTTITARFMIIVYFLAIRTRMFFFSAFVAMTSFAFSHFILLLFGSALLPTTSMRIEACYFCTHFTRNGIEPLRPTNMCRLEMLPNPLTNIAKRIYVILVAPSRIELASYDYQSYALPLSYGAKTVELFTAVPRHTRLAIGKQFDA